MSDLVELEHPNLPDRRIRIPEAGVWHRERAGWRRTGEQTHPGYGEPLTAVEHPADGSWSPAITNDPDPSDADASDDTTETER